MDAFNNVIEQITAVIWADWVLYVVLGVGVLFTIWSGFSQYRALTHGVSVTKGDYDDPSDPGAISHFQALSAALSATVGLGNIAGVAIAIAIGGPGALFWMWVVGIVGMAIKTTEVCQSMLFRDTSDPENPHGGPMFVVSRGMREWGLGWLGTIIGGIFCVTLLISAVTGGNMFQSWSVGGITREALSIPEWGTGLVLAVIVAMVILGGIKRIGSVAGVLVPFMCVLYVLTALVVLSMHLGEIPGVFASIFTSAFAPSEAGGAFIGGAAGTAFLWGMKRALFSSECGQGSSPIAHSAAQTKEPVSESVVAGLEPFIDTLVVCTLTALMILSTGALTRESDGDDGQDARFASLPTVQYVEDSSKVEVPSWVIGDVTAFRDGETTSTAGRTPLPERNSKARKIAGADWRDGDLVFVIIEGDDSTNADTESNRAMAYGKIHIPEDPGASPYIRWDTIPVSDGDVSHFKHMTGTGAAPALHSGDIYKDYTGATLTAYAINRDLPGFGTWLILISAWLFAISTMISWSYYGEQGIVFLFVNPMDAIASSNGDSGLGKMASACSSMAIPLYKMVYCLLIIVATMPIVETAKEIGNLSDLGTGIMLWANIPIMLLFGFVAMKAYHSYFRRLKSGEIKRTK